MTLEELTTYDKLANAFYDCKKPSWWKERVQRYELNICLNTLNLQEELRNGKYKVSPTNDFVISERGKRRYIQAPIIKDRIVQKVLCKYILIPQLTKPLIYDNYASLKNRGTSFARKRIDVMLQRYLRKHDDGYVLQIDIRKFFDSVDHDVLKRMLHERIKEPKEIMTLIDYMVDASSDSNKGLNLGSEAPQIFAIFYLSKLDNYIKSVKSIKYYGRYMDDMIIISDSKDELKELLSEIQKQLSEVKLEVNQKKTHIVKLPHGFTFMQIKYHVKNGKVIKRPTHTKIVRERRRLKKYKRKYAQGLMTEFDINNTYKSWRNNVVKDCNACSCSIYSLDRLYSELFPNTEPRAKPSREKVIKEVFKLRPKLEYNY